MYSLSDYLWMIADHARVAAYAAAIRAVVTPGDRVLDVGAGFGFFSVIAAAAGAQHVDAAETNPAIHLGPRVAAANGCAERITFHHQDVRQLSLAIPADVLIADVRGPTPFGRRSLEVMIDARDRLLRPGGRIIPRADRVLVAPSRTPAVFRREVHAAHGQQGIDLAPVEQIVFDTPMRCLVAPEDLLAEGRLWVTLDYTTVNRSDAGGAVEWRFDSGAAIDGLAVWFETDLGGGCGFSTAARGRGGRLSPDVHPVPDRGAGVAPATRSRWTCRSTRSARTTSGPGAAGGSAQTRGGSSSSIRIRSPRSSSILRHFPTPPLPPHPRWAPAGKRCSRCWRAWTAIARWRRSPRSSRKNRRICSANRPPRSSSPRNGLTAWPSWSAGDEC